MQHLHFLRCSAVVLAVSLFAVPAIPSQEIVAVDAQAPATPFPHFWEGTFGSGRAILSLRESYRNDLRAVKQVADFNYVRFHAISHDEIGVYNEDAQGNPVYNFSYVDQIYDGLLANGVRPFVEISLMPRSSPPTPARCIPSGTSPSFHHQRTSIAGTI